MTMRTATAALVLFAGMGAAAPAHADWDDPHFEMGVGFLAGGRSYDAAPFALVEDDAQLRGIAGLRRPFESSPYQTVSLGPRIGATLVLDVIRVSGAWQRAYPTYANLQTVTAKNADGELLDARSTGLTTDEWRLGLGLEPRLEGPTPFVDLVGDIHKVNTTLAIDGERAAYRSEAFSMALRGGLRIPASDCIFVELAGEWGFAGPTDWGASIMVGAAIL
jgi:hypothetical protein